MAVSPQRNRSLLGRLSRKHWGTFAAGLAGIALLATLAVADVPGDPPRTQKPERNGSGAAGFIGTNHDAPIRVTGAQTAGTPEKSARVILDKYAKTMGIDRPGAELKTKRTKNLPGGRSSVRFQQVHRGVPVIAGELIVNMDKDRNLLSLTGETSSGIDISTRPSVSSKEAQQTALKVTAKNHRVSASALRAKKAELAIYDASLLKSSGLKPALVWKTEVTSRKTAPIRQFVLVDATTGNVALHFNQIDTARKRKTYTANNTTSLPGTAVCTEADPTCSAGDNDAQNAHIFAGDTYDFYSTYHGRDSYNGAGATMESSVHYGAIGYQNAFWNGTQVAFGDNFSDADDVVAHEWTHAVTMYESGLYYYYESGAINESLSDVWGEFVDQTNGKGNDAAGVKWLMGEDIGAIRSMSNPPAYSDPDKMSSALYYLDPYDNGGVHYNSGVNNKAAYLMTDGGTFNGETVSGLGITKTAKIYYEVQTNLLTSGANYSDLASALYQGCQNLVGTAGISAPDCQEVQDAVDAVEMSQTSRDPNWRPVAALCPNGSSPTGTLFFNDMEAGGNWSTLTLAGTSNSWLYSNWTAASGLLALRGRNLDSVSDSVAFMNVNVAATSDSFLQFKHMFAFETGGPFDGGVIEYSLNGGAYVDASSIFDAGQGYNATLDNGYQNPLGGRSAFTEESHGYVSSRYDLDSLQGNNIKFRFRAASDSMFAGALGWTVDDVRIYTCDLVAATSTATVTPSSPDGSNGWYTAAPIVALSATDGAARYYQWDGTSGAWSPYSAPVTAQEGNHTLYYRSIDGAGNTEDAGSVNIKVDSISPENPSLSGSGHAPDTFSSDDTVTVALSGGSDLASGISGYSTEWNAGAGTTTDTSVDHASGTASVTSAPLADGSWYFHLRTKDNAGNWSGSAHLGPFKIDKTAPSVTPAISGFADSPTQISLMWTASTDSNGVAAYRIYNGDTNSLITSTSETSRVFSGLVAGTYYSYYVRAADAAGNQSASSGKIRLNPGGAETTPHGSDVQPVTVNPSSRVSLTFSDITSTGSTQATPSLARNENVGGAYLLKGEKFEIETTASFTPPITVAMKYDPADFSGDEDEIRLFHYEGGTWVDITVTTDAEHNVLLGETNSLSPFGAGEPGQPALVSTGLPIGPLGAAGLLLAAGASLFFRRAVRKTLAG